MTTIPTIDQISGNTVMKKFRNLAKTVIDVLTQFGDRTDYLIEDLTPRLEQTLIESIRINDALSPMVGDLVTKSQPSVITALLTLTNGLSVTGTTTIDGNVQITNGHSLSVANNLDIVGNAIIRGDTEIGGMSVEESNNKTLLSNDNGISFTSDVTVPDTIVSSRNSNAVNGTRLQNDLDAYPHVIRTTGAQTKSGELKLENWLIFCGSSGLISRALGYHKVIDLGTNLNNRYIIANFYDRYGFSTAFFRIIFDESLNLSVTLEKIYPTPTQNYLEVGAAIIDSHLWLIIRRISGNNIYTRFEIKFHQRGTTQINESAIQTADEVLDNIDGYQGVIVL